MVNGIRSSYPLQCRQWLVCFFPCTAATGSAFQPPPGVLQRKDVSSDFPSGPLQLWRMEKPLCSHQLGISISGGFRLIVELSCMWKGKYLGLGRLVSYTRDAENQPGQEGLWAVEVVSQGFRHGFGKGRADLGQCSLRGHFVPWRASSEPAS